MKRSHPFATQVSDPPTANRQVRCDGSLAPLPTTRELLQTLDGGNCSYKAIDRALLLMQLDHLVDDVRHRIEEHDGAFEAEDDAACGCFAPCFDQDDAPLRPRGDSEYEAEDSEEDPGHVRL